MNIEVDTASYKHLQKTLQTIGTKFPKEVVNLIHEEGLIIETKAKRNIMSGILEHPNGILSSSIHSNNFANGVSISADKKYAAFVEFGTGDRVEIPSGWEAYAAQFKGKNQDHTGVKARPYLIKAFIEESKVIPKKLVELYKRLIR